MTVNRFTDVETRPPERKFSLVASLKRELIEWQSGWIAIRDRRAV